MTKEDVKKILVIRFRQIGDSILATALCRTLKQTFPNAEIHFVLNKGIAPLFENHPDIDRLITFSKDELKSLPKYLKKVRETVRENRYDVIIDMRTTIRTLWFSLFSRKTPFRVGRKKSYSGLLLTDRIDHYDPAYKLDMVSRNNLLASPLEKLGSVDYSTAFTLGITPEEIADFREYMVSEGIDFSRPVMLVGVTTKITAKKWPVDYMVELLREIMARHPELQLVFNYAPGVEETEAREIWEKLKCPECVKINLQADSLRKLAALCANCDGYFGNEGGTRHIVQAMERPSFSIFSPYASKSMWLPQNRVYASGIEAADLLSAEKLSSMTPEEKFAAITPAKVLPHVEDLIALCAAERLH